MSAGGGPEAPLERLARAKINLYLRIVGRREDGYHELQSLIAFTDLADRLSAAPAARLSLEISGPFAAQCGAVDDNLVLRAARVLARETGHRAAATLHLVKNIPVAAGLGGGSADAAAALLLLQDLWGARLAPQRLRAVALELGADIPACLAGGASIVAGVGDALQPASRLPGAGVLLVNPGRALTTAAVFAALAPPYQAPIGDPPLCADPRQLADEIARRGNGLTVVAQRLCPAIAEVLAALRALPGARVAQMSGSGASCFALFDQIAAAQEARVALQRLRPAWFVHAGGLIG